MLGSARIIASYNQIALASNWGHQVTDQENWDDEKVARGYAGAPEFRMFSTISDMNNHWVELHYDSHAPDTQKWERVVVSDFHTQDGSVFVSSVIDFEPTIKAIIKPGSHSAYFLGMNIGVAPSPNFQLTEKSERNIDCEWYRIILVPKQSSENCVDA
tara:strand:- start:21 stop:494 length:474 start_codon:yes stop_codon:yes gene_type:complete